MISCEDAGLFQNDTKNLSSRQQIRNIYSEFSASLLKRLAVLSLTQKQSLQLSRKKSPRPLQKKKKSTNFKTKDQNKAT